MILQAPTKMAIWEQSRLTVMARVGAGSGYLQQSDVSKIECTVWDLANLDDESLAKTGEPVVSVSSSVFNSLQTSDSRWTNDSTGYNFRFSIPGNLFPEPSRTYSVEFVFYDAGFNTVTLSIAAKTTGVVSITSSGSPPSVDPPAEDDTDDTIPSGVTAIYIADDGDTSNSGLDTDNPVTFDNSATDKWWRVREVAYSLLQSDADTLFSLRFARGDTFPVFDTIWARDPDDPSYKGTYLSGTASQYLVIKGWGTGARPIFENGTAFLMDRESSYIEVNGIEAHDGLLFFGRSNGSGCRLIDNVGVNANVVFQAEQGNTFDGLYMSMNVIRDVMAVSGHRSGVFLGRVNNWEFDDNIIYRCGWNGLIDDADEDLEADQFNQGLYASGSCGPAISVDGNVAIFNAGAGLQVRPGGNTRNNFCAWNGFRGLNWCETRGAVTNDIGGTGTCSGNVAFQDNGAAFGIGNVVSGTFSGNTGINTGINPALTILARAGTNPDGGTFFGINNLTITGNSLGDMSSNGTAIRLENTGWGAQGGDGVNIYGNDLDGSISPAGDFDDPNSKVIIGSNDATDLSSVVAPTKSEALVAAIIARTTTAADLIATYGA